MQQNLQLNMCHFLPLLKSILLLTLWCLPVSKQESLAEHWLLFSSHM